METLDTIRTIKYRHFKLSDSPVLSVKEKKGPEFFYVGRRAEHIDLLIRFFSSGYAAENPENADFIISRLISQNNTIPDVIIMDGALGMKAVKEFYKVISSNKLLLQVPFILDGTLLDEGNIELFKQCVFIDEIVFLQHHTKEGLSSKIDFLRKIKQRATIATAIVESSQSGMCGNHCIQKRIFDIIFSSLILILLSPVFFLIALAIKLESRGPVFYVSKRAGRGYNIFNFYKFRTMFTGADSQMSDFIHLNQYTDHIPADGPAVFIKFNNDPRVTRVGAFLRRLSLDELPQLINVLKGDMSLVGNRPLPLYEAAALTTDQWAKRFLAPAGMTGLWQIKKNRHEDMTTEERILLDCDYAEKSNFLYDLWIMAKTPSAIIQKTNA